MYRMGTQPQERIPHLSLGWRLRMAMEHSTVSRAYLAEQLGVDPASITRWTHDKGAPPKRAYLAQWALITGTDLDWLLTGGTTPNGPPGDGLPATPDDALARLAAKKRPRHAGGGSTTEYPAAA